SRSRSPAPWGTRRCGEGRRAAVGSRYATGRGAEGTRRRASDSGHPTASVRRRASDVRRDQCRGHLRTHGPPFPAERTDNGGTRLLRKDIPMLNRRTLLSSFAAAGLLGTAAACSPTGDGGGDTGGGGSDAGGSTGGDKGTLTFRLWDQNAVPAYEESFEAFTAQSGWNVKIDVVSWDDYWTRLPLDIASGDAADVYWVNSANFIQLKDSDALLDINEVIPDGASQWEQSVVELYTRDGGLWGVPQIWDSIAVFYNKELVEEAGVDPSDLAFDPTAESDSLREAGRALTVDGAGLHPEEDGFDPDSRSQFGFNSQADRQAIIGPLLASNGAQWQDEDEYTFASPEGIEAFQYMADLVNAEHIAPSAADTNENGDFTRDLFTQGKLGLFQSGP